MIRRLLHKLRNPHNLTRIYHARDTARFGDTFGDYSYGRLTIRRWGEGAKLQIGTYCAIADGVTVLLGGNHRTDWGSTYPFSDFPDLWPEARGLTTTLWSRGDVTIGSDVWIGAGATILSGVTIGHGAVIGTRALVTKDVPPYAIVAGNPAEVMKLRFKEAQIASLLASPWWERPRADVARLVPLLQSERIDELIEALSAR